MTKIYYNLRNNNSYIVSWYIIIPLCIHSAIHYPKIPVFETHSFNTWVQTVNEDAEAKISLCRRGCNSLSDELWQVSGSSYSHSHENYVCTDRKGSARISDNNNESRSRRLIVWTLNGYVYFLFGPSPLHLVQAFSSKIYNIPISTPISLT